MWIFFGILAAFFFALEDICVKTLIDDGLSVYEVIAFSFVFAGILSIGYLVFIILFSVLFEIREFAASRIVLVER